MISVVPIQKKTCRTRTTSFQWQEILFPLVTRVVVEGSSRNGGTGKETAWLENVQRLAGSCLDRGSEGREGAWRGRKDAAVREGVKKTKRSPEGVLFTLATSNRTVAVDPLKNGFTTCCWRSHLKIPLDIERISEKEGDTPSPSIPMPVPQYHVNISPDIKKEAAAPVRKWKWKRDICVLIALDFCLILW